ncbi:helicase-related protein [Flavobacterium restrictum]|uniref:AAA family ATPase n=1 Tax=Flavobacterium restrictum TaxID=2594428 RepID=A0A553EDH8_9FLAO|nr:helicase-related protein [Flavobacterium restrictum]TRX43055.1 AAA family ATPase [Flavobacterium restrictum]
MIIDNENQKLKVHEWITKYNEEGTLDVVTGYFTIGALAYLSKSTNDKIENYRFVLGDIVNFDKKIKALDLLNESIDIDTSFQLNRLAKEAVSFLQLDKVVAKTLEPNFCHAKLYLKSAKNDDRNHYFISGSSNLTEAGIGQKTTSNVELNIAETGNNNQYKELIEWFNDLWNRPQAHSKKTLIDENGKLSQKDFKQYLIDEISKLFEVYTPEQIYYKILFELFHKEQDNPEVEKQLIKLEDTVVFNKLYDFQKGGVNSLIRMLNKYNGAILADAVGLGKTWSALAVMKSFQHKADVLLLCPKKLEQNWKQYIKKNNSIFEEDKLDFDVKFHTDLRVGGFNDNFLQYLLNDKSKLLVIDESHNLRNDKSSRYKYLIEEILQQSKGDIKILLLSATPINNSFKDIRNQFKLMTKGENTGFKETLDVNNIESTFREIQTVFNKWSAEPGAKLSEFHSKIKDSAFFRLTDHLLVARTRKNVKANFDNSLTFPIHKKPINIFKTPLQFGDVENFAEFMDNFKLNLSAYQPSYYTISKEERKRLAKEKAEKKKKGIKAEKDEVLKNDVQREHFLVKMMMILMLKRLESSWYSFQITVDRIYNHHENAIKKINQYQELKEKQTIIIDEVEFINDILTEQDEEELRLLDSLSLGKKTAISLKSIDDANNLDDFKKAINKDKIILGNIRRALLEFEEKFKPEKELKSIDTKLDELLAIIIEKQKTSNKKIVIFSVYKDTVEYLFDQLTARGFTHFAMVSGDENKVWNETKSSKKHENVLERFAPYTKLFKEKNWTNFVPTTIELTDKECYQEWQKYIQENEAMTFNKLENQIDILIATDVLSEGQNLQDADMVINYDIHWNPVRVIQRVGRIDRIGSPNTKIQTINFWPAKDIDGYIRLKERVEKRMAIMKISGSEVIDEFTDEFNELAEADKLEDQQNANMLRQMETTMQDIDGEQTLGFDDFSFDNYRQLLQNMLNQKKKEFENMPNGVFSGIKIENNPEMQPGIISLLGYPAQKKYNPETNYLSYELIYIDLQGNQISNNQKVILEQLNKNYTLPRAIDPKIESGDTEAIKILSNALKNWINNQAKAEKELEDGTKIEVISNAGLDLINKLKTNPKQTLEKLKIEGNVSKKFNFDNFDLITWLIIS